MALHSFDAVFTSASQLLLLLPVAGCILLVLVAGAFADVQCRSYMVRLDSRLSVIRDLLQLPGAPYPQKFLQNIFLPLIVSLPATPVTGFFLVAITPWLALVLLLNLFASGLVIAYYNRRFRESRGVGAALASKAPFSDASREVLATEATSLSLPSYLLRDQLQGSVRTSNFGEEDILADSSVVPSQDRLARRKRQALGIVRSVFQGLVLAVSAVLALLQLSSLGSIVGFFIISNSFRKAFIALFEFSFPRSDRITLGQAYGFLEAALLSPSAVAASLQQRYDQRQLRLKRFNQRYGTLLQTRPFFRFRSLSLTHVHDGLLFDKITSRLELASCTLVRVPSAKLAQDLRVLLRQLELQKFQEWQLSGEVICAGQRLTLSFLHQLPFRSPWKIRLTSARLETAFAPNCQEQALKLIRTYELDQLLYGDDGIVSDLASCSRRQLQRLRSIICLLVALLEPVCFSVVVFSLESFEVDELTTLVTMMQREAQALGIAVLLLTRKPLSQLDACPRYELSRSTLNRLRP